MDAIKATDMAMKKFSKMMMGQFDNVEENVQPMYECMSEHVDKQRKRLGGDMAIAQAVFSRNQRDKIREILGPDLVLIVLNMTEDCMTKRIKKRHGESLGEIFLNILKTTCYDTYHDYYVAYLSLCKVVTQAFMLTDR